MELVIANSGQAVTLRLADERSTRMVRVGAGRTVRVDWPVRHGRYDVRVTAAADPAFLRTLTSHL
uniref:phospholipase domain-containing protein n=1 Tax=Actinokineospora iranica TaxID=1271860 RepID=UPI002B4B2866|nr:phospholipase domain-containing protein [Actinokineospora iranica]